MSFFYATHIIDPFLNSRISANHEKVKGLAANHDKVKGLSANSEIIMRRELFLYCKISFGLI